MSVSCCPLMLRILRLEEDLGVAQSEAAALRAELAASQKDNLDMVAKVWHPLAAHCTLPATYPGS